VAEAVGHHVAAEQVAFGGVEPGADPALLVLDEPTAHLDPENRRALTADLLAATAGRSVLLITHDLDGLDEVDEIVVLDCGRVAERGTYRELITAGGVFQRMWQGDDCLAERSRS
jgi:ATP-binding cassette, subfamily C, bacterial CydC